MKVRTLIITAGASFALVAPAAQASVERILPQYAGPTKAVLGAHKKIVKTSTAAKASKHVVPPRVIYIYFPGPSTPVTSAPDLGNCATSMVDCTDQQNCDIWGFNCPAPPANPQAVPVDSAAAALPTGAVALAESSTSDLSTATNASVIASTHDSSEDC